MSDFIPHYKKSDLKSGNFLFRTQSLFWEHRNPAVAPLFTTKDEDYEVDGVVYPSLKKIYMGYDHIPEYEIEFANEVLGGWLHWQALCANKLFRKMITQWREEKTIQLQASGFKALMHTALFEGSKGTNAAKYLADKGWIPSQRGRPSKEEMEKRAKEQEQLLGELSEDVSRLGLTLVK